MVTNNTEPEPEPMEAPAPESNEGTEYEQVRQRAVVQQEYERVQRQLESQGASPEEAQQQASQYIQRRTSQQDLMRQADAYGKELIAKQNVFECYTRKVISELPGEILNKLDNVDVIVSSRPTEDQLLGTGLNMGQDLLGIYEGIPITERYGYELVLPDKITLFQDAIESLCSTEEEIMTEIRATIIHEIAHHFGLDDQELEELNI